MPPTHCFSIQIFGLGAPLYTVNTWGLGPIAHLFFQIKGFNNFLKQCICNSLMTSHSDSISDQMTKVTAFWTQIAKMTKWIIKSSLRQQYKMQHTQLTRWGWQWMTIGLTPAHRTNRGRGHITPVIIRVLPAIEVDEYAVAESVCHSSNTHQAGVLLVYSLQLHPHTERRRHHLVTETYRTYVSSRYRYSIGACQLLVNSRHKNMSIIGQLEIQVHVNYRSTLDTGTCQL